MSTPDGLLVEPQRKMGKSMVGFLEKLPIRYQILPTNSLFWRLGRPPEALCVAQLKADPMSSAPSSSSFGIAYSIDGDGSNDDSNIDSSEGGDDNNGGDGGNDDNGGGGGGGGSGGDGGGHIQHRTIN
jgi:uncharacterized membrane protein YgcG